MTEAELAQLKTELDTDPLALGYAGQPNTQGVADLLNDSSLSDTKIANTSVLVDDIMDAIDPDELANIHVNKVLFFLSRLEGKGSLDISEGSVIKGQTASIFTLSNAPISRAALDALKERDATRGEVLFGINIIITHTDVGLAKAVV